MRADLGAQNVGRNVCDVILTALAKVGIYRNNSWGHFYFALTATFACHIRVS